VTDGDSGLHHLRDCDQRGIDRNSCLAALTRSIHGPAYTYGDIATRIGSVFSHQNICLAATVESYRPQAH
jgi:hypothetical protein